MVQFSEDKLKEGLQILGSNLSDKEFNYLLEKVGTSHDGKISLREFDEIIHSEVGKHDSNNITNITSHTTI